MYLDTGEELEEDGEGLLFGFGSGVVYLLEEVAEGAVLEDDDDPVGGCNGVDDGDDVGVLGGEGDGEFIVAAEGLSLGVFGGGGDGQTFEDEFLLGGGLGEVDFVEGFVLGQQGEEGVVGGAGGGDLRGEGLHIMIWERGEGCYKLQWMVDNRLKIY